jgi:transforming growth factor-beta-induced protein
VVAFVNETETLFQVVVDFGLADAFVGAENWTVFGPDNATFAEADLSGLSEEEVQAVLQYHVIAGDAPIFSAALVALLEENEGEIAVETAQGEELTIAVVDGDIVFNDGQATLNLELLDIDGSNGVLHVIQGLLLPPSFTEE